MTARQLKKAVNAVSSKWFLLVFVGAWIIYYVTFAIWSEQAFARFMRALSSNLFIQSLYALFLVSAFLNLFRISVSKFREERYMFLAWIVLPLGVVIFLTGFFLSTSLRNHEKLVAGEGQEVRPYWRETAFTVSAIHPSLKDEMLDIDPISIIFQYEPKVMIESEKGLVEAGVFPPKKVDDTYIHILQFGIAPGVRLTEGERILREGYLILRLLPPGVQDEFFLPPFPYAFSIRMTPERVVTKGRTKAKIFNINSPSYEVTVKRGQQVIFEGDSTEDIEFDGLTLSFKKPTYWVLLDMAEDPGLIFILVGLVVIAAGVPLMFLHLLVRHSEKIHR